jgi:hypothetical protein
MLTTRYQNIDAISTAHLAISFEDLELAIIGVPREALSRLSPSGFYTVAAKVWDLRTVYHWTSPQATRPRNYTDQLTRRLKNEKRR